MRRARCLLLLILVIPLYGLGCTAERSFFQMDSDSRVPFFGMDFRFPRRESSFPSVRRFQDSEMESATQAEADGETAPGQTAEVKQRPFPIAASPTDELEDAAD